MDSFVLVAYASFKNPLAMIASLSELYSVGANEKKNDFYELAAAQAAENHGDE